ncbi:dolichol kinase [Lasioglossum baleicum]|uniref:dolichol kinase n=1 Tax=Lasioglossum baleicum TaxID=434251 RepID=UPI003FCC4A01
MDFLIKKYVHFEENILQSLRSNDIGHRSNANVGLWLGMLVGFSAILNLLKEDTSYSEICLIVGLTGVGLVISSICLYLRLSTRKVVARDFQVTYFLPAIVTSMLYLFVANKGLLSSVTWGVTVGSLGTWSIIQLMSTFPNCFTLGEATAVVHSCILFVISAVTNLPLRYHLPPIHDDDIATVLLQVAILYIIVVCLLCGYFPIFRVTKYFYIMMAALLVIIFLPILHSILDQNPLTWMFSYMFSSRRKIILFGYWAICLLVAVIAVTYQILWNFQATSSIRKIFHILAVLVYVPGLIYEQTLLYFASGVIMGLFIFLELVRYLRISPLGEILEQGFSVYADEKDNLISLTALYLLSGLSFPLWMPSNNVPLVALFSGVLTVGVGDTTASIVGSKWGFHKWSNSNKSIEGTLACIFSQAVSICALTFMGYIDSYWLLLRVLSLGFAMSFVEAQTNQVDNLALPLLMYVCLII